MLFLLTLFSLLSVGFSYVVKNSFVDRNGKSWSTSLEVNQPGLCDTSVKSYSGYFNADDSETQYFFWFFESRSSPSTDPTLMWLTGGPGCSSMLALLSENGPCSVNTWATGTENNPYSWTTQANALWVDQPPGTGFTTGPLDTTEQEIAEDMYAFLQNFMAAFPQYFETEFFVTGESYAGHYVPVISHQIYVENKAGGNPYIPLEGFAVGNGMTDPYVQFAWYAQMAYNSTTADHVISKSTYNAMTQHIAPCQQRIAACNANVTDRSTCTDAFNYCNEWEIDPVTATGVNPYNLDIPCEYGNLCYNFTEVDTWLNNITVQKLLGVDTYWEECATLPNLVLEHDWVIDYSPTIPPMLEDGIRGLIYAGDLDFICNYLGNEAWSLQMPWSGQQAFVAAPVNPWSPDGKERGMLRTAQGFSFLQVYQAGHMVPADQPQSALYMINQFMANDLH